MQNSAKIIERKILKSPELKNQHKPVVLDEGIVPKAAEEKIDYKAINIPGISLIDGIDENSTARKTTHTFNSNSDFAHVKVHKTNNKTIFESETDYFIFNGPAIINQEKIFETETKSRLTQIQTTFEEHSEQEAPIKQNIFLKKEEFQTPETNQAKPSDIKKTNFAAARKNVTLNKRAYMKPHQTQKSGNFAITILFLLVVGSMIFILRETNILDVKSIASYLNIENDSTQTTIKVARK